SGLGAAAFIVLDDSTDTASVAASVSRFLAVESCGQCTPCKQDGLAVTDALARIARATGHDDDVATIEQKLETVTFGARCSLATQEQVVITSFVDAFGGDFKARIDGAPAGQPLAIVPIADLVDGVALLDSEHARKQPDWTFGDRWSGQSPA